MIAVATRPDSLLTRMEGLSDPTRLRLLHLLEKHELGVAELVDVLRLPQSTVSRHLKTLAHQGWVRSRGRGATNLYRMATLEAPARRLWALARDESSAWATLRQDDLRLTRRLRDRAREAEAFFEGAAGGWERLRTELYGSLFTREALLALLPSHWVVADLGCGTGPLSVALAPHVARVIGVDQSAAMLRTARRVAAPYPNVELHEGRLESLPLADGACDAALLVLGLSYVPDPAAVVGETARVLRSGGCAVVVDLLPHDNEHFRERMGQQWLGFDRDRVSGLASSAGLALRSFRELAPEPGAAGPALFVAVMERKHPQGKLA